MKIYLDCIPCFFRQAIEMARMAGLNEKKQKKVIDALAGTLPKLSLSVSPPEVARMVNKILKKNTRTPDLYAQIKQKSNDVGLRIYDKLKKKVACSKIKLLTAVEIAIIGNIIDYGAKNHLEVDKELDKLLYEEEQIIKKENKNIFGFRKFAYQLQRAKTILYLADNAGETVFDRVLIEEIKRGDETKEIIYAVKEKPVINDALIKDALVCGIDKTAEVISSGSDAPGTVLRLCSKKFLKIYNNADMIISKGQGNFEALSNSKRPVFFMFIAKCAVIAKKVNSNIGDIVLLYHHSKSRKHN
ncbi:MAG: ARMT1-like domain-containing protein [Candidatus Omnitrophota bacterium]